MSETVHAPDVDAAETPKRFHLRTRDVVILGILGVVCVGGPAIYGWRASQARVWVVNGLDIPLTVDLDGARLTVEPKGRADTNLGVGVHRVRTTTASGAVVEELPIDVPAWADMVAYDPLGAAPLYDETIVYSNYPSSSDGSVRFHGGERLVVVKSADFVFTDPPQQITVKESERRTREHVAVADGGWTSTAAYFIQKGDTAKAIRLQLDVARASGAGEAAAQSAAFIGDALGDDARIRILREAVRAKPEDSETHSRFQHAMRLVERDADLTAEYEALRARWPDSPFVGAAAAYIGPQDRARAELDDLVRRHPDAIAPRDLASHVALLQGDAKRVVELLEGTETRPEYLRCLSDHARALVVLGKVADAAAVVDRAVPGEKNEDLVVALAANHVAALPGAPKAARREPSDAVARAWMHALAGESPGTSSEPRMHQMEPLLRLQAALALDPAEAIPLLRTTPAWSLASLHTALAVLFAGELERLGDRESAERVISAADVGSSARELLDFVRAGAEWPSAWRVDPEVRAALELSRARWLIADGKQAEAKPLLEAVKKHDILRGPVTRAMEHWPAPNDAKNGLVLVRRPR